MGTYNRHMNTNFPTITSKREGRIALQKNELLTKLEKIRKLYNETLSIQEEMDNFVPEDCYDRKVVVPEFPGEYENEQVREVWKNTLDHTEDDAIEIAKALHIKFIGPKEPEKPVKTEFKEREDQTLKAKQIGFGCLSYIAAAISAFFFLGALVGVDENTRDTLPVILGIAITFAAAFAVLTLVQLYAKKSIADKIKEEKAAHDRQQAAIMADYAQKRQAFEYKNKEYKVKLQKFLEDYAAWREIYLESVAEEEQIEEQLEADRVAAVEKIYEERYAPVQAALDETNDLITQKYLPALDIIIDLLRSGRADDLKEAINLFEDIVYRERQLALEREMEEQHRQDEERHHREQMEFQQAQEYQRQREEQQRQKDAERHHQEQMKFQQDQERQRQREEQQRQQNAERQRREEMSKQRDMERKQESAAQAQCRACANVGHCNMSIHNKTPNCTGFRPR